MLEAWGQILKCHILRGLDSAESARLTGNKAIKIAILAGAVQGGLPVALCAQLLPSFRSTNTKHRLRP